MPSKETEKKGGLTLEKLISYDDVITDALVDKVGFGLRRCSAMFAHVLSMFLLIGAIVGLLLDHYQEKSWRPLFGVAGSPRGRCCQRIARRSHRR
jgi:hypothetical protein